VINKSILKSRFANIICAVPDRELLSNWLLLFICILGETYLWLISGSQKQQEPTQQVKINPISMLIQY